MQYEVGMGEKVVRIDGDMKIIRIFAAQAL
jgi:hypothetical protein